MSQVTEARVSQVRYGSNMEFRALGPVEVLASGQRLEIGGKKQRTVLALLLANAGQPVSTDRLIEAAHGDDAPRRCPPIGPDLCVEPPLPTRRHDHLGCLGLRVPTHRLLPRH